MNTPRDSASKRPAPDSIRAGEFMPSETFRGRLRVGAKAWRALLARGLPTIRVGKQAFVDSDAAIRWFRSLGDGEGR